MNDMTNTECKFTNLVELLDYRYRTQADSLAYIFLKDGEDETESLTYGQLYQQAQIIADYLNSSTVKSSRALLLYNPGLEFITAFLGCLSAGVVAIPIYLPPRLQKMDKIRNIIADAQTNLILTTKSLLVDLMDFYQRFQDLADIDWVTTDNLESQLDSAREKTIISGNSLAFYQYTSGSTHHPKGVMISHSNILHNEQIIQQAFRHDERMVGLGWLPHYHDMGLIGNIIQPLYMGRPCVLMSPLHFLQQPFRWLKAITKYRATSSGGPNFAYNLCVQKITPDQKETLDLSCWKVAFIGADIIYGETLKNFAEAFAPCGFSSEAFYPCYGMAESTLFVTGKKQNQPIIFRHIIKENLLKNQVVTTDIPSQKTQTLVGCGNTWLDHEILIVDLNSLLPCPPDRIGEVWVKGASVAQGYWNRFKQTQETFFAYLADRTSGPFLRTGDLGFIQDNNLFITGRLKDLIVIRGENYYPYDIELTVQASSIGLPSNAGAAFNAEIQGKEQLVIVQEVERTFLKKLNFAEVIDKICKKVMIAHGLKVYAVALIKPATIPKTSSGKVKRYECKQSFLNNSLDIVYFWSVGINSM